MKKYHIVLLSLLLCILGGLINCGGKQRPWNTTDQVPPIQLVENTTDQATTTQSAENTTDQAATPTVLYSDIQPLFQKHCMICHRGIEPKINWLDYATAKSYADNGKLYERIWTLRKNQVKAMPLGNSFRMTLEERKQIVQWIEDGGPQ